MLKNILNLNGAQPLSKNEQKSINGGGTFCVAMSSDYDGLGCFCGTPPKCTLVASDSQCHNGSKPICP